MKLTTEERRILEKLSQEGLRFLSKISEDKDFVHLKSVINYLIDTEKNIVFGLLENEHLAVEHAYSRGKVAGHMQAIKLITAARSELERREQKRKEARHGKS